MNEFIVLISSFDKNMANFLVDYGIYIYIILFLVVYSKTAFVILTFIPGDSLVFASGTLAAMGELSVELLFALFLLGTVVGDSQNFWIGKQFGKWPFHRPKRKLLSKEQLEKAEHFVGKYGKYGIVLARFVPFMRTTIPFVSGFTKYQYRIFIQYNLIGGVLWVMLWLNAGYLLGNLKWVENNLILALTIITLIPIFVPTFIVAIRNIYLKGKRG